MRNILLLALLVQATASARAADAALIAAAKSEGRVVWYTTQQIDPIARPIAAAFEKKYSIKVDFTRADSSDVALRILAEGNAGRMQSDVFDGTAAVVTLKKRDMVAKYLPETAAQLPKEAVDANGYWAATNLFVITAAHNTDLVPRDKAPKTWDDLLAPQWKGKIVWPSTNSASAAAGFVGLVIAERGREAGLEFLKRLAAQNVTGVKASARQVLDQIVAGEFAIGLQMFNHATVLSAQKGAPVAWIPVNPALATPNVISLTANGPHPNAGKLFMDFALSREGQELFRDGALLTVHPQVAPMDATLMPDATRFGAIHFTPEKLEEELPAWQKIVEEIFR